jgi:hypothetical protein
MAANNETQPRMIAQSYDSESFGKARPADKYFREAKIGSVQNEPSPLVLEANTTLGVVLVTDETGAPITLNI